MIETPIESHNEMNANIRVFLKPKASTLPQMLSPQELQIAYQELLITFSDLLTSASECRLVGELIESYDSDKVMHSADSYKELYLGVETFQVYDDFKYTLINDSIFVRSCEDFENRKEPTSAQEIMAAL